MKYLIIFFVLLFSCIYTLGQDTITASVKDTVAFISEIQPEFPGGEAEMRKFISTNMKYPPLAIENGIKGKVMVSFVVEKNGSLSNITIKKGLGYGCDEEVIRVIKAMPPWKPGEQKGKKVRVLMTLPISFNLK